jgi:hypothetical protein
MIGGSHMETSYYSTLPKSGNFRATTLGKISLEEQQPKTRFDINDNVDYEKNIIKEAIDIICESSGVAYLFYDWQVDAIYNFFDSIFIYDDQILSINSVFSNKEKPDYYAIRKIRPFTRKELRKIKETELSESA